MNGGRLSNDETFLQGAAELRQLLQTPSPEAEAVARAVARVAVRYPDEAEQLAERWGEPAVCQQLLRDIEAQHRAESEDE